MSKRYVVIVFNHGARMTGSQCPHSQPLALEDAERIAIDQARKQKGDVCIAEVVSKVAPPREGWITPVE